MSLIRTAIFPRDAALSRSPFLLRTVVSVTRPHWSEAPTAISFAFGVLICVVRMSTQPVSLTSVFVASVPAFAERLISSSNLAL